MNYPVSSNTLTSTNPTTTAPARQTTKSNKVIGLGPEPLESANDSVNIEKPETSSTSTPEKPPAETNRLVNSTVTSEIFFDNRDEAEQLIQEAVGAIDKMKKDEKKEGWLKFKGIVRNDIVKDPKRVALYFDTVMTKDRGYEKKMLLFNAMMEAVIAEGDKNKINAAVATLVPYMLKQNRVPKSSKGHEMNSAMAHFLVQDSAVWHRDTDFKGKPNVIQNITWALARGTDIGAMFGGGKLGSWALKTIPGAQSAVNLGQGLISGIGGAMNGNAVGRGILGLGSGVAEAAGKLPLVGGLFKKVGGTSTDDALRGVDDGVKWATGGLDNVAQAAAKKSAYETAKKEATEKGAKYVAAKLAKKKAEEEFARLATELATKQIDLNKAAKAILDAENANRPITKVMKEAYDKTIENFKDSELANETAKTALTGAQALLDTAKAAAQTAGKALVPLKKEAVASAASLDKIPQALQGTAGNGAGVLSGTTKVIGEGVKFGTEKAVGVKAVSTAKQVSQDAVESRGFDREGGDDFYGYYDRFNSGAPLQKVSTAFDTAALIALTIGTGGLAAPLLIAKIASDVANGTSVVSNVGFSQFSLEEFSGSVLDFTRKEAKGYRDTAFGSGEVSSSSGKDSGSKDKLNQSTPYVGPSLPAGQKDPGGL